MMTVTANDLKKQGISILHDANEALITVRGQPRYVILDIQAYEELRENELTAALCEARDEIKKGHYFIESPAKHVERIAKQ